MTRVAPNSPARPEHADGLRMLEKIIRCYHGFQLVLALYNDPPDYRNRLIIHLNHWVSLAGRVDARPCTDFAEFERRLVSACATVDLVHVVGLDAWLREAEGEKRLQGFNLHRETLASACRKPIVLWLPVHLITPFALLAPDFWEWRRAVVDFSVEGGILPDALLKTLDNMAGLRKPVVMPLAETLPTEIDEGDWGHARFMAIASQIERWQFAGRTAESLDAALKLYRRVMAADENAYPEAKFDSAIACLILGEALSNAGVADQALPILKDAQQRFERIGQDPHSKRLAVKTLIEQGDSFRELGRLDEAANTYGESIRRSEELGDRHSIAIAKSEFGSVYVFQQRYSEALLAYGEAREIFHALGDWYNLAAIWQLIGRVYAETGRYEEAEHAFLVSLAMKTQLADKGGVAYGIGALGSLYASMNRLEDAVASSQRSVDKFAEIGDTFREVSTRISLAGSLFKLTRIAEARDQILQAIQRSESFGHAAKPWNAWNTLRAIETSDGNTQAAEQARRKALELFLAYRREGGENHQASGLLCAAMAKALLAKNSDEAQQRLNEGRQDTAGEEGNSEAFLNTLTAIAAGQRDPALADNPALSYDQAVETILLLEALQAEHSASGPQK